MYISGIGVVLDKGRRDKFILKDARRADSLSRMSVLAAYDAFADSGLKEDTKEHMGIILATAFGPHVTTFRFLDEILNYGDANVSPTLFSHSVHNAACSYISSNLGIYGPAITVTDFNASFYQAILVAQGWLREKRCAHVLVGYAEEFGPELDYVLKVASDKRTLLEGSMFFLISAQENLNSYCTVCELCGQGIVGPEEVFLLADRAREFKNKKRRGI